LVKFASWVVASPRRLFITAMATRMRTPQSPRVGHGWRLLERASDCVDKATIPPSPDPPPFPVR
jgi:hypothetical protein